MARNSEDRSLFLRMLATHPYIYYAAKKAGISPATIHRWMNGNPKFKKEVERLKREGLANQNEGVEMVLVKKSMEGSIPAIKFYLPHNDPKYKPQRAELPPPAFTAEQMEMFKTVHEWHSRNVPIPPEIKEQLIRSFKAWHFMDEEGNVTQTFLNLFKPLLPKLPLTPKKDNAPPKGNP